MNDTENKDRAPEGITQNARDGVPSQAAYTTNPPEPEGDALPQDGSLSLNDTEPIDQRGLHDEDTHILQGSEATQTAGSTTNLSNVEPPDRLDDTANTMASE